MKSSPKGSISPLFSPLHSHQKALPFGNLRKATLPFQNDWEKLLPWNIEITPYKIRGEWI
ncbi:MAG: hypothetical protein K6C98_03535 [Treponema sp.]|nr:hypothetical protein [Treponema sp.]